MVKVQLSYSNLESLLIGFVSNSRVRIISNHIELHSPNGGLVIGQAQAALRATTPTGVGLLIIGAFVFLASWWLLDTRRRKGERCESI